MLKQCYGTVHREWLHNIINVQRTREGSNVTGKSDGKIRR